MMRRGGSIRLQLLVGVAIVTLVTWVVVAISGYYDTKRELDELLDGHLAQSALMLMSQLHKFDSDDDGSEQTVFEHHYERRLAYQVWNRDHTLLIRSSLAPSIPFSGSEQGFTNEQLSNTQWRVFSAWNGDRSLLIQVGELLDGRLHVRNEIIEHLLLPLLVALPCLGLLLALVIHRALKPLDVLAQAVARRKADNLMPIGLARVPSEAMPLVNQLNDLLQRMKDSLENERRFTGDASHELRTPVAAIRAHAQVASQSQDDTERNQALKYVITGCDRISHLIEQLLTLSRLDTGKVAFLTSCDLRQTTQSVLSNMAQEAVRKNIQIELHCAEPYCIQGNEALLQVLIRNLIDNAIRYSPPNKTIQVNLSSNSERFILNIVDQGPGIPKSECKRVLDRFYRIVGSEQSGSGLGLSIVRRIAEIHDAILKLDEGDNNTGLKVSLIFRKG